MALDSEGFLSGSTDRDLFHKEGRRFDRKVSGDSHPNDKSDGSIGVDSEDLLAVVTRRLAISAYEGVATFGACVVRVNGGDGMSWSAQSCYEHLRSEYPQHRFRLFTRNRTVGGLPTITTLVPTGTLIKVATKHGLLPRRSRLPWLVALVVACVLAAAPRYLDFLKDRFGTLYPLLAGVLAVLVPIITEQLRSTTKRDRILGDLAVRLSEDTEVVAEVADELALRWLPNRDLPRFVVIDHYQSLDPFSRRVVKRFFAGPDGAQSGDWYHQPILERWLVFEEIGGGEPLVGLPGMGPTGPSSPRLANTMVLRQEPLDRQSRQQLADLVGRPERAGFTTVKSICEETAAGTDKWLAAIQSFRESHTRSPETANALDLLFLLAVASEDCPLRFTVKSLADDLAPEKQLRGRLLRHILRGARLTRAEIHDCLQDLRDGRHGVALIETETGLPTSGANMQIAAGVMEAVIEHAAELDLPEPRHGHLFWAIFWFDRLRNRPMDAGALHGLSYHLRKARPSLPAGVNREELEAEILPQLLEATLFAIGGCLRTCLLREVPVLIGRGIELINRLSEADIARKFRLRLVRRAWEAYAIIASPEVLKQTIAAMQGIEATAPAKPGETAAEPVPSLDEWYCNLTPLDDSERALMFGLLRGAAPGRPGDVRTFVHQSRTRAAWYALTVPPKYLSVLAGTRVAEMHRSALAELDGLAEQALANMQDTIEDELPVAGGLTLSLALWSKALRCSGETRRLLNEQRLAVVLGVGPSDAEAESPASETPPAWNTPDQDIAQLHSLVARTLDLALQFGNRTEGSGVLQRDFLRCAIGCELVAVSFTALVIGHRGLAEVTPDADASADDLVRQVLNVAQRTFGLQSEALDRLAQRHPAATRGDHWRRLAEQARDLMSLAGLLWDGFGVSLASASLALRRFHLESLFMADDAGHDVDRSLELARKTAPVGGPLGLLADLVLSANLRRSGEIAAYRLCRTVLAAFQEHYGEPFKQDLAYLAIHEAHMYGFDAIAPLMAQLFGGTRAAVDYQRNFVRTLRHLPATAMTPALLGLFNAARLAGMEAQFIDALAAWQPRVRNPSARKTVDELLSIFRLDQQVARGQPVDAAAQMAAWATKRDSWLYAWILQLIVRGGNLDDKLLDEVSEVLSHDPAADTANSHLLLALAVAGAAENGVAPAYDYIAKGIGRWEQRVPAEIGVQAYTLLHQRWPSSRDYMNAVLHWQMIMFERDQMRLADLTRHGKLFLVFEQYCRSLEVWGLPIINADAFHKASRSPSAARDLLKEWLATPRDLPAPIVDSEKVNGDFLRIGCALFHQSALEDLSFDRARALADAKAAQAIDILLHGIVTRLPGLPTELKRQLGAYARDRAHDDGRPRDLAEAPQAAEAM